MESRSAQTRKYKSIWSSQSCDGKLTDAFDYGIHLWFIP